MYCYNCGHKIKDGALFCGNCGVRVEIAETEKYYDSVVESETEREVSMTVEQILQEERQSMYDLTQDNESSKCGNQHSLSANDVDERTGNSMNIITTVPDWRPAGRESSSTTLLRAVLWAVIGIIFVCAELCIWFFATLDLGGRGLFKYAVMGCVFILSVAAVLVVGIATGEKNI